MNGVNETEEVLEEEQPIEISTEPPKALQCSGCETKFKYGELVFGISVAAETNAICAGCFRKEKSGGKVAIFGGGVPSVMARDKARRNAKKLERWARRQA